MKKYFVSTLLMVVLALFFGAIASASGPFDPKLEWKTIETGHFYVHYHEGTEKIALELARESERALAELTDRLDHSPRAKVHLVVSDSTDFPNGITRVFPYPQVLYYPVLPRSDSDIDHYDKWIRTIATHELTHIVVIDMTRGLTKALRYTFGYSIAMNGLSPRWLTEGSAVYSETELTTSGRGRSAYLDMVLRMAILENNFPSIDRAGDGLIDWPGGSAPYLFGYGFYSYLVDSYGEEKVAKFWKRYSGQLIPFRINGAAKKVFGEDFATLWDKWKKSLEKKYSARKTEIEAEGVVMGKALTDRGFYNGKSIWTPSAERIIFSEYNPHTGGSIRSISRDGSDEIKIRRGVAIGTMSLDPEGKHLLYSKAVPYKGKVGMGFYSFMDLYQYDMETKKSKRLTNGERALDSDWSPDGRLVVFTSRSGNGVALKIIGLDSGEITTLIEPQRGVSLDGPRFSPDGLSIVLSVRKPDSGRDIYIIDVGDRKPRALTYHPARDLDPVWSPDGKHVLFTSERTGVPNIYAIDASTGELARITNVIGGAFAPSVSRDGKWIAYSGYSSRGYDLYTMPCDPSMWKNVGLESDTYERRVLEEAPEVEVAYKPYRPYKSLLPKYLIPLLWYDGVDVYAGLSTGGADPLGRHAWFAGAMYGSDSGFLNWNAAYSYSRFIPSVGASASQRVVSYGEILLSLKEKNNGLYTIQYDDENYYEEQIEAKGWIEEKFGFFKMPLKTRLYYVWRDRDNWTDLPELTFDEVLPGQGTFSGMGVELAFGGARSYGFSISPEMGFDLKLGFEWLDESFGSDYDQRIFTGDLRMYLPNPLLRHHVFALRAAGGLMDGDKLYQGTFRVGGMVGESILSSPGSRFFMLRGYEMSDFIGDEAMVMSGEYRFPIAYPQRGGKKLPVFVQKIHGALFVDYGGAFDRKTTYPLSVDGAPVVDSATGKQVVLEIEEDDDWNTGVGGEVRFSGYVGYGFLESPVTLRLGYANDVEGKGLGSTVFMELGTSF